MTINRSFAHQTIEYNQQQKILFVWLIHTVYRVLRYFLQMKNDPVTNTWLISIRTYQFAVYIAVNHSKILILTNGKERKSN